MPIKTILNSNQINYTCDKIGLIINEFSDTHQYPQFDVKINDNIVCTCKIPTRSEFLADPYNIEVIEGDELSDIEKKMIVEIFKSFLNVETDGNILSTMRMFWNCFNCDGITFNSKREIEEIV